MDARVRQKECDLPDQAGQVGSRLPDPEHGSDRARADAGGELLRRALAPVLTQRMGDLVPHHGRDLVVCRLELLEDAGVKRDLAAGHAPRIDLRRGENVHLPFPTRRVLPEHTGLRDDAPGDGADALDLLRIAVDVAVRALLLEYLLVGERRALVHLRRRDEEELAALDPDGALFRRRRARDEQHQGHRCRPDATGHPFHHDPSLGRWVSIDAPGPPAAFSAAARTRSSRRRLWRATGPAQGPALTDLTPAPRPFERARAERPRARRRRGPARPRTRSWR